AEVRPQAEALAMVPWEFALRHGLLPILYDPDGRSLSVAMANPLNVAVLDKLQTRLPVGTVVKPVLAGEGEIAAAIARCYGVEQSVEAILRELAAGESGSEELPELEGGAAFTHPMTRLVDALLLEAVKRRASDIHINPGPGFVRIRYRLDGVLRRFHTLHKNLHAPLVVRIKVLAGMNIAETRIPQDGRISLAHAGREIHFRISLQPVVNGENIVIRVLDPNLDLMHLDRLGIGQVALTAIREALARPEGLILVTGPTGSGKTTLLYAMLRAIDSEEINIMTMEDPVEYPIATLLQTQVDKSVGLDYAAGVRSLLWQDPDVILVGEIHDEETARMALQAAMTGHKVLATLHAHSALGAIPRLLHLGVAPDFLAGNLNAILAQRLVRRLCACHGGAHGCHACGGSGYRGRAPILEIVRLDEAFDDLIHRHAPLGELRALAVRKGYRSIVEDGEERVREGITDRAELGRVLDFSRHPAGGAEPEG
ncbi:MAG: type II/IV secretion system protein, partial [Magnetococcales bacterium]|nr:type II/IV secretion system protein [Magnetococcales bacterium]